MKTREGREAKLRAFENPTKVQLASQVFYDMFRFRVSRKEGKKKNTQHTTSLKKKDGTSFAFQIRKREKRQLWRSCVVVVELG